MDMQSVNTAPVKHIYFAGQANLNDMATCCAHFAYGQNNKSAK